MEVSGKKYISLYLEDWQMRMVKDFLGVSCHQWTIPIDGGGGMRYMGPALRAGERHDPKVKRMYLTEWQRHEIKHETGESCEWVELHPNLIVRYAGPPFPAPPAA